MLRKIGDRVVPLPSIIYKRDGTMIPSALATERDVEEYMAEINRYEF